MRSEATFFSDKDNTRRRRPFEGGEASESRSRSWPNRASSGSDRDTSEEAEPRPATSESGRRAPAAEKPDAKVCSIVHLKARKRSIISRKSKRRKRSDVILKGAF